MSLQPILLIGLVLAALLYAWAALIFLRKGMRTIWRWSALIGVVLLGLPLIGFLGFFFGDQPAPSYDSRDRRTLYRRFRQSVAASNRSRN